MPTATLPRARSTFDISTPTGTPVEAPSRHAELIAEARRRAAEQRALINPPPAPPAPDDDWHEFMKKRIAARARGERVD